MYDAIAHTWRMTSPPPRQPDHTLAACGVILAISAALMIALALLPL